METRTIQIEGTNQYWACIPVLRQEAFNKTYLIDVEGALRQMRFKKMLYRITNRDHDGASGISTITWVMDIAGLGERKKTINLRDVYHGIYYYVGVAPMFYASVADFKERRRCMPFVNITIFDVVSRAMGMPMGQIATASMHTDINNHTTWETHQWRWDGTKAVMRTLEVPQDYVLTEGGLRFAEADGYEIVKPSNAYPTKDECEDNNVIELVTFDTEEDTEEELTEVCIDGLTASQADDVVAYAERLKRQND